jgi:glycosyltransferase involved in cell wall biosynthesis
MLSSNQPLVSVLLPVYNGAEFLAGGIESILSQSYRNIELIIIDDGSSDNSLQIVGQFHDPRMRVYHQKNQGLAAALNRAIHLAKGEYLARQDHDDFSLPKRLEKQVTFLEGHPNCGMVGGWAEIWVENVKSERIHQHPADNLDLKFDLLFDNPFVHSSMMLRKAVFDTVGLYSTDRLRQPPEDYELWSRVARCFDVANISEVLLVYREVPSSLSRAGVSPFLDRVVNLSIENLHWATGRKFSDRDVTDLAALNHAAYHRVSPNPSLRRLSQVVFEAADQLSATCHLPASALRERAQFRYRNVRNHCLRHTERRGFRNSLIDLLGAAKRILKSEN